MNTFSIHVSIIQELVTTKVIEFGNFSVCFWLEQERNVELGSLEFSVGNRILHEIACSPYAFAAAAAGGGGGDGFAGFAGGGGGLLKTATTKTKTNKKATTK